MALQKTITLPNSTAGNYIMLDGRMEEKLNRQLSAHFLLYVTAAARASAPESPLGLVAKLRLDGDKYDEYLSEAAIAAVTAETDDKRTYQIYRAAKLEPLQPGLGLRVDQLDLSDAADV
jgi:hypothetical protein